MMDFPAPVSPVRTVSPFSNETVNSSMIAKFLMVSSANTHLTPLLVNLILYRSSKILLETVSVSSGVRQMIKMVSSPQIVPIISSQSKLSIKAPIA